MLDQFKNQFDLIEKRKENITNSFSNTYNPYNLFKQNHPDNLSYLIDLKDNKGYKLFENDKRILLNATQLYLFKFLSSINQPILNKTIEIISYIRISQSSLFLNISFLEKNGYIKKEIIDQKVHYYCYNEFGRVINKNE